MRHNTASAIIQQWTAPESPNYLYINTVQPDQAALMLQIIAKLEELDRKVNVIDCKLAEPEKEAFKDKLAKIAQIVS